MATFGDIRSILHGAPGEESWGELCGALEALGEYDENFEEVILPYVEERLEGWDTSLRVAPPRWVKALVHGGEPRRERLLIFTTRIELTEELGELSTARLSGLFQASVLANIKQLECTTRLEDESLIALSRSKTLRSLDSLLLPSNSLTAKGVHGLVSSDIVPRLEVLDLNWNDLDDAGAILIGECERWERLHTLRIEGNGIMSAGGEVLCQNASMRALRVFAAGWNDIASEGVEALTRGGILHGIERLGLENNSIRDGGVVRLLESASLSSLRELDLYNNHLTDRVIKAFKSCEHLGNLVELDLSANAFERDVRGELSGSGALPSLSDDRFLT